MTRDIFLEIMRYLRFDLKTERRRNLLHDKFARASQLWNNFISNCQKAIISQSMSSCCHLKHVANSSNTWLINQTSLVWSSGWQLGDVENKYLFNRFP